MELFVILPILFFSIVLHEFAHGYVAYHLGAKPLAEEFLRGLFEQDSKKK